MKITLTQTQTVTKTIQFEYSNGSYLKALGELIVQEGQVEQNRAMNKTRDQKLIEHNIQRETLEDEAEDTIFVRTKYTKRGGKTNSYQINAPRTRLLSANSNEKRS